MHPLTLSVPKPLNKVQSIPKHFLGAYLFMHSWSLLTTKKETNKHRNTQKTQIWNLGAWKLN